MALEVQSPSSCSLPATTPASPSRPTGRKRRRQEDDEDCVVVSPVRLTGHGSTHSCPEQHHSEPSALIMEPTQVQEADTAEALVNGLGAESCQQTTPNEGPADLAEEQQKTKLSLGGRVQDEGHLTLRDEVVDKVWDEFATNFLAGSCHIQQAAIFDLASRRPLAVSGELKISAEEMEQLVTSLNQLQIAYRNGVTIGGKTYKVKLADGRNGILARSGSGGCTVCKTHTLIIIGVHDHNGNSRKCNEDVMRLGDFFRWKAV